MVSPIPNSIRKLWKEWNVRGIILFSLGLQTFLIMAAPTRKRTSTKFLILFLWTAYLLADWAANFAIGHISSRQNDDSNSDEFQTDILQAFWAPFLLLHLGGPDTITAFSLEDNELWLRHLLGLITQVLATVYVFIQTVPGNSLWMPTTLMFLSGIIKYSERTRSLFLASLNSFRESLLQDPDAGPNYAKLMEEYSSKIEARLPTRIQMTGETEANLKVMISEEKENLEEIDIIYHAYHFYNIFKGLIVDSIFSFRERDESKQFFENRKPIDAFRVLEVELNFIYEALFTKVLFVRTRIGYVFRFAGFSCVVAAFGLFLVADKDGFMKFDVAVTYTLLFGAIILDFIALFMLVFSDWTVIGLQKWPKFEGSVLGKVSKRFLSLQEKVFKRFLSLQGPSWSKPESRASRYCGFNLCREAFFRRWSESVSQYNFISYSLQHRRGHETVFLEGDHGKNLIEGTVLPVYHRTINCLSRVVDKVIDKLGATNLVDELKYVGSTEMKKELWDIIFEELRWKASEAEDAETTKRIYEARGSYVLRENKWDNDELINTLTSRYIEDLDYDEVLLLWHIATELCYQSDKKDNSDRDLGKKQSDKEKGNIDRDLSKKQSDKEKGNIERDLSKKQSDEEKGNIDGDLSKKQSDDEKGHIDRDLSKKQSDEEKGYMDLSKKLSDYMMYLLNFQPKMMSAVAGIGQIRFRDTSAEAKKFFIRKGISGEKEQKKACESILGVNTDVEPVTVKGDRSKSVLFDACILAKKLQKFEGKKWNIMVRVWVEMLSYAASHCRPDAHVQQVSKGGELLTFVWLLMAHFGLGEQFQINQGHARAKLIVEK